MPKKVEITPEVAAVLDEATWTGDAIRLPERQLDRPVYDAVAKTLGALGLRWNRKLRGFACTAGEWGALTAAIADGVVVDQKRTLEQFFTPPDLAQRVAAIAAEFTDLIEGPITILEPEAGDGRLLDAFARNLLSGDDRVFDHVHAIEIDAALCEKLRARGVATNVICADFMTVNPLSITVDLVIMNPPFSRNKDIAHVMHALEFLRPGGRLVAIMSPHFMFAPDSAARAFRTLIGYPEQRGSGPAGVVNPPSHALIAAVSVEMLMAGMFKHEGTNIAAVLVTIDKAK